MRTFLAVKFALLPFAALWVLLAAHHPVAAIYAAIAISAFGNLWNGIERRIYVLEAGALALFLLLAVGELLAPGWYFRVSETITTAVVAVGTMISIFGPRLGVRYVLNGLRASQ